MSSIVENPLDVPGNASRSFSTFEDAISQPRGVIQLDWDESDPYLRNSLFESSIIKFDDSYCTSVCGLDGKALLPTLNYFNKRVIPLLPRAPHITDVGCGQGEFVHALRQQGIDAIGFDPVLRSPSGFLSRSLWRADEAPQTDLLVMRCVLPHIAEPWNFLLTIAEQQPKSLVLIEFQRIEWIINQSCWFQLCHDHVNLFSLDDFASRFRIIGAGTFSRGEWGWVLIDPKSFSPSGPGPFRIKDQIDVLLDKRIEWLQTISRIERRRYLWGGAAKGTVLADAMRQFGVVPLAVVDADDGKWGRHLEGSGVVVVPPQSLVESDEHEIEVIVSNPNHYLAVKQFLFSNGLKVRSSNFGIIIN